MKLIRFLFFIVDAEEMRIFGGIQFAMLFLLLLSICLLAGLSEQNE